MTDPKQSEMFDKYELVTPWGTVTTFYDENREKWRLLRDGQTYYNEKNVMREWDSEKEAIEWIESAHPVSAEKRKGTKE